MARNLADLEKLLTDRGYPCKRVADVCVLTQLPTQSYRSPTGAPRTPQQVRLDAVARRCGGVNRIAALVAAWKRHGGSPNGGGDPAAN